MNIGHAIFKRMQRFQGGTAKFNPDPEEGQTMRALPLGFIGGERESRMFPRREPPLPRMNTWADYFATLMQQMKQDEIERLKEIDPDMVWNPPTERPPDEGQRQRFQRGVSTVSDEEYDEALDDQFDRALRKRRFKPKKGPQFDPRDVPVFYDIESGQKIFDPKYSSSEDAMYAQGGTGDVRYTPVTPTKEYPYSTDYEFIHRKILDNNMPQLTPEEEAQEEIDWQKNIKEILGYTPDLDAEEQRQVRELNPKDWDDSTREKVGQASEQAGRDTQLQQGTSNVNNPGLRLFMAGQGLHRKKRKL